MIPARGGSKRIPKKNVRDFHGQAIIGWSIQAAHDAAIFDRVIVSTDDPHIARVAAEFGAEVPFQRPESLSDDHTGTNEVVAHAGRWLQETDSAPSTLCCLYATAPFVRASDLQRGFETLRDRPDVDFTFSATEYGFPIHRSLVEGPEGCVQAVFPEHITRRSQDLPTAIHDAGQFYWGTLDAFERHSSVFTARAIPVLLPRVRVQDIDTEADWEFAELLFQALDS